MIAVVDMEGRRLYNSLSYQKALGYSPEELQASSSFEQIHPDDRDRVKKQPRMPGARELGKRWSTDSATRMARGWCWNQIKRH